MPDKTLLVVNSGSSSIKLALFAAGSDRMILSALGERLNSEQAELRINDDRDAELSATKHPGAGHAAILDVFINYLSQRPAGLGSIRGVGHRVVHGGEFFSDSALINDRVESRIEDCNSLAPLHNPANLMGIREMAGLLPNCPQVAVFDTAFHQTLPPKAFRYAIPARLYRESALRRYGFHGTSHRYVAMRAAAWLGQSLADTSLISAHLGDGCSVCRISAGQSVDTSMGFTPLEGLPMGTRSGSVDPGLLLHLLRGGNMTVDGLDDMLHKRSGLLGLSEISNDMRTLVETAATGNEAAALAIDVFCYQTARSIASYWSVGRKPQAIVLTGGIGENAAAIRARIVAELAAFDIELDEVANERTIPTHSDQGETDGVLRISRNGPVAVLAISTNEELMIARDTQRLIHR